VINELDRFARSVNQRSHGSNNFLAHVEQINLLHRSELDPLQTRHSGQLLDQLIEPLQITFNFSCPRIGDFFKFKMGYGERRAHLMRNGGRKIPLRTHELTHPIARFIDCAGESCDLEGQPVSR